MLSLETKGHRRTSALGSRDSTLVYSSLEFSDLPSQAVKASGSSKRGLVGRQGFEPWKPMATDLQSAPFVHLGTCPNIAKSLDSFSYAQNKPSHSQFSRPRNRMEGNCSGWTSWLFPEAGNFTNDLP